ncbi:MAG: HEAT repeat domain-containing protein [Bryobacterales bacterium]|nr:HEAT repeat domain-containing protein [Bryobacterales bacterium]
MAQQTPGNTQAAPPPAAKPKPKPLPTIPPELDALPIWKLGAPALVAMVKDPKSTLFQKAIACKKLSIVGGKEAIPPMAALLSHPQLSCYARFGMEPNPDPSVDEAFRAALPKLTGKLQIGVINSIGVRRDAKAVDALAKLIDHSDPEIAQSAAASVGMIGGPHAARVLQAALSRTQAPVFPVAARAMLLCAEDVIATNRAHGLDLYRTLSAETMPKPVRLAALRVLNEAGPAPEYTNRWPAPTGEAAARDKSGFLGR